MGVKVLGIETSCDETAAAVVEDGHVLLSNVVASQVELHARYGGVVPEVASRQHVLAMVPTVRLALEEAGLELGDLGAVAVTRVVPILLLQRNRRLLNGSIAYPRAR